MPEPIVKVVTDSRAEIEAQLVGFTLSVVGGVPTLTGPGAGPGGGGVVIAQWVNANHAGSPYVPVPGTGYIVDPTGGVVFNPAATALGQTFAIKAKVGVPPTLTDTITINEPTGGQIEQPVPDNGTYGTDVVLNDPSTAGTTLVFVSDGTNLFLGA